MMNANSVQLERMGVAAPGRALVSYEGLMRPFEAQMVEWLGHKGAPDYIHDSAERKRISDSLDNHELMMQLRNRGCGWRAEFSLFAFCIDLLAVREQLDKLDSRLRQVFKEIARLRDASAEARIYSDFTIIREAAAAALGRTDADSASIKLQLARDCVKIALKNARMNNIGDAVNAYTEICDALESKREGWPQFGPEFSLFIERPREALVIEGDTLSSDWQFAYRYLDLYASICDRLYQLQEADDLCKGTIDAEYYSVYGVKIKNLKDVLDANREKSMELASFHE